MRALQQIDEVRTALHEAGVNDALQALVRKEHDSYEEAMETVPEPAPATDRDAQRHRETLQAWPEHLRAFVRLHGAAWAEGVRERWLAYAADVEARTGGTR